MRSASFKAQARFMRTCLQPIAGFRWSRWPWQRTYANCLDSLQRHIIHCIRPLRPAPEEAVAAYVRRRCVICGRIVERWGKWSKLWAQDVHKWDRHILRAHDPKNWSLPLRQWHGEEWLEQQRFDHSAASHWGRTQTRALPGHPATRWHEGVQAARRFSEASEHLIGSYGV